MHHIILLCLGLYLFLFPNQVRGEAENGCYGAVGAKAKKINGFTVSTYRYPHQRKFLDECAARVADPSGKTVFSAHDHGIEILSISGQDLNGDGELEVVFEGYTGGAHCCWNYWIVSLGKHPGLLAYLYNERPVSFLKMENGQVLIDTFDGRFDYFDGLSHTTSVFPRVFLRLCGKRLEEVNLEFWSAYLKDIEQAKKSLTSQELVEFRQNFSPHGDRFPETDEETRSKVLTIILAYLYGGKPEEAWKALDEMWPPQDRERIKKLILATRGTGFAMRSGD
jgi:hypothetical protein